MYKIGQRIVAFEGAGEGTPGGQGNEGAAHPVEAPWASAEGVWSFGEGDGAKPWFAAIPEEDARQHIEAKGYKNPAELALANLNLTKLHRGDPTVVGLPGDDATPEQMAEFYNKIGRPADPTGYEFKFADGVEADPKMMEFARTAFHEVGLNTKQAQLLADKWNAFMGEQQQELLSGVAGQNDQELADLATRWGADLDKNKAAGHRAVQALGLSNDLIERVEQQIGSAAIVELLASIGRKSDEGGFTGGSGTGDPNNPDTMSKEQAQARITALHSDDEFQKKYTDRNHPGHKEAVDLMQRLYARS